MLSINSEAVSCLASLVIGAGLRGGDWGGCISIALLHTGNIH